MRIWDINPGYLNRQSLLGEHRELHGLFSILINGKKGYSRHPETLRWVGCEYSLKIRHSQIAAEMKLRGYNEKSPLKDLMPPEFIKWPEIFIDPPATQFAILEQKYEEKGQGRIPLPQKSSQLWAQHKYSVLARDQGLYKEIGREVSKKKTVDFEREYFFSLATLLAQTLKLQPSEGGVINALQHMWGHVSKNALTSPPETAEALFLAIQNEAKMQSEPYLLQQTALSELGIWGNIGNGR